MPSIKVMIYIAACALSCVQIGIFSHYKVKGKSRAYTVSKMLGSLLFVAVAACAPIFVRASGYSNLIFVSMLLSLVGDYFLAMPHGHHRLKLGVVSFTSTQICLTSAFISIIGFRWKLLPIIAGVYTLLLFLAKLSRVNFRGAGKIAAIYSLVITIMMVCACALIWSRMPKPAAVMTAAGGMLFYISDLVWIYYGFKKGAHTNLLKVVNVVTYFSAQMLIAGALWFL